MRINSKEYIDRELYPEILKWIDDKEILAISGPRQSGKTTILKKLEKDIKKKTIYVNFEDPEELQSLLNSPQEYIKLHLEKNKKTYFLFDEFQYVKNGGKLLKLLFDQFSQVKFIITGSSSLKIQNIASKLVGRVIFFNLFPLSFGEYLTFKDQYAFRHWKDLNSQLNHFISEGKLVENPSILFKEKLGRYMEEYLVYGGYPAVVTSSFDKKRTRLENIVNTYIEKDIIKLLQIGDYLEFRDLTKILATRIGNLLNYSGVQQDAGLNYRKLKKYLGALSTTFIIKELPPFSVNKSSEIRKSPKLYYLDLGLRNERIKDYRKLELRTDKGAIVENFVFQNLYYRKSTRDLKFWRTKQGAEVDFLVNLNNHRIPIEVKFQSNDNTHITKSFKSYLSTYSPSRGVVLTKNTIALEHYNKIPILFTPVWSV